MGPTGLIPLGGVLQSSAAWVETTWLHYFATNYKWVWATMETLHFLGMGLLVGTVGDTPATDRRRRGLPIESTQKLAAVGHRRLHPQHADRRRSGGRASQYLGNFAFQMKVLFGRRGHQRDVVLSRRLWPKARRVLAGESALGAWLAERSSLFL
jgi:hypothetical protein